MKRNVRKLFAGILLFSLVTILLSVNAFAYLDPSAMTYVIQVVAGVIIAGGAGILVYWKKIRLFFKKRKNKKVSGRENTK